MTNTPAPHEALLAEITAYLAAASISKSAFGLAATGDPRLVSDLEAGREPRWATIAKIRAYMATASIGAGQS